MEKIYLVVRFKTKQTYVIKHVMTNLLNASQSIVMEILPMSIALELVLIFMISVRSNALVEWAENANQVVLVPVLLANLFAKTPRTKIDQRYQGNARML